MLRVVCLLATCLLDRAWSSGSHNEDYEECREHEYPCFVQTGHSALHAQKYEEAVEWFKKAADEGYAPGLDAMGFLYQMGQGVPLDREKAFEYYEKAAEAGDEQGLFHLGACYSAGIGIKKRSAQSSSLLGQGCGIRPCLSGVQSGSAVRTRQYCTSGQEESTWPFREGSQQGPPGCNVQFGGVSDTHYGTTPK